MSINPLKNTIEFTFLSSTHKKTKCHYKKYQAVSKQNGSSPVESANIESDTTNQWKGER